MPIPRHRARGRRPFIKPHESSASGGIVQIFKKDGADNTIDLMRAVFTAVEKSLGSAQLSTDSHRLTRFTVVPSLRCGYSSRPSETFFYNTLPTLRSTDGTAV